MRSIVIIYILFCVHLIKAQEINIHFYSDTLKVHNIFTGIEKLFISTKINPASLEKNYWILYSLHNKNKGFDEEMIDIKNKEGDVFFGYFIKQYIDSICIDCPNQKKDFLHWYLMNYYFVPSGLLYGNDDNTLCPCLIKKIEFPDAGTYFVDSLSKLHCVPIERKENYLYKNIFTYNPLSKNWKKFVYGWEKMYPQTTSNNSLIVKHGFKFSYQGSMYSDSISFNALRFSKNMPSVGKDASVIDGILDYNIDTSLIKFLATQLKNLDSDAEKVGFILSFVQQAIKNKTDIELLNIFDKTLLPEETLFRGAGDCEDKSFLLVYLFKKLLPFKKEIIVVIYDNHVNVGIKLKKDSSYKNFVKYKGRKFILCETTNESPLGVMTSSSFINEVLKIYCTLLFL